MPTVRYTGGSRYALRDGPTWEEGDEHDVDDETADRLTDLDKFVEVGGGDPDKTTGPDPVTYTAEETIEAGECPWCDGYEGDAVGRHASAAHPDEWAAYKEER